MRLKIDCCWGCPDRQADPNCHGYCEKYKQQKAEYDETMAEKKKKEKVDKDLYSQMSDGLDKVYHHRNLHHKTGRWR